MNQQPSKVWVCLCDPSDIRNIGGAIRAVANFGLAGLKVISSRKDPLPKEELKLFSSGASPLVTVTQYQSIIEATESADLIIGTSRRRRDHSHLIEGQAHEIMNIIDKSKHPHLLFGNERVGLSREELDLCHALVEIHSSSSFPSLNLAHAVACLAYEISRPLHTSDLVNSTKTTPVLQPQTTAREDEAFLRRVLEVCDRCDYPPSSSSEHYARRLRSLIRRANPSPGDYGMILGLFRELDRLKTLSEHNISSLNDQETN